MEEVTEGALEKELEEHLVEQRASLAAVDDALSVDLANPDLLLVREELVVSVKEAEESLLHLKGARLYREVDALTQLRETNGCLGPAEENNGSILLHTRPDPFDVVPPRLFEVGSKCRFRHTNGRWYNGGISSMDDDAIARVSFLTPTAERFQMCRFYLQQQCRFGGNCRMSHGMEFPLHSLHEFKPPDWEHIPLGSAVLACDSDTGYGLWRAAELESWDEAYQNALIVFSADGRRREVSRNDLAASEHASASDREVDSSSDDHEDSSQGDSDKEGSASLFGASLSGPQTETVTFANWERHTRGMASKMMASMGFCEGMGLGKTGQGITQPIRIQVLPAKQSLEYVNENRQGGQGGASKQDAASKKKSRGGKRKRDKKFAAAARAAKTVGNGPPDVFDFINQQLSGQQDMPHSKSERKGSSSKSAAINVEVHNVDRHTLLAHEDEIKELRSKVSKLEEMAVRNRKDKAVFDAVGRKLEEAHKALLSAEAAHLSTTNAVHKKEKEKKWLRF